MAKIIALCLFFVVFVFVKDNEKSQNSDLNDLTEKILIKSLDMHVSVKKLKRLTSYFPHFLHGIVQEDKSLNKECVQKITSYANMLQESYLKIEPSLNYISEKVNDIMFWAIKVQELEENYEKTSDYVKEPSNLIEEGENRLKKINNMKEIFHKITSIAHAALKNISNANLEYIFNCSPKSYDIMI